MGEVTNKKVKKKKNSVPRTNARSLVSLGFVSTKDEMTKKKEIRKKQ